MVDLIDRYSEGDCKLAAGIALHDRLPERYVLKLEVKIGKGATLRGARLDMAIFDRETRRIVLIIETKRSPGSTATSQGERYRQLTGARVLYLRGYQACRDCLPAVLAALPAEPMPG